ncbi:MAG: hypothetical protein EON54_02645 [Alcaligenaceae bacterium]|nr:MAG: hypothetical protein EON54_02645 [Alcaligenaceae bacterium]
MTLPYERRRALEWAGELLRDLRSPHKDHQMWDGSVPEKLRLAALRILRHYPEPWQIDAAVEMDDVPVDGWIAKDPISTAGRLSPESQAPTNHHQPGEHDVHRATEQADAPKKRP